MDRRVALAGLVALPLLPGGGKAKAQAKPPTRTLTVVGDGTTGFTLFTETHLGHTVKVQFMTDSTNFWFVVSVDSWNIRIDLGDGEKSVTVGPLTLMVTVSNLVFGDKITFHLKVAVSALIKITLFDKDVSINRKLLVAKYSPLTHPTGTKLHTVSDAKRPGKRPK